MAPPAPEVPGVIVEPVWLESRMAHGAGRAVDLRDRQAYLDAHIPGAVWLDLAALGESTGERDNVLLGPTDFARLMGGLGISDEDAVVAYDDQWGLAAARLVWALHRYGHGAAGVLDGGWDRWLDESRPTESGEAPVEPGSFTSRPDDDVFADRAWIEARMGDVGVVLLDTRTPAEFDQGHLPGARCWDWFNAVPGDGWGVSRPAAELMDEWSSLGAAPDEEVVVYCRSGMRAAHTYAVLKNAGYGRVRLYDGSWQDWSGRP